MHVIIIVHVIINICNLPFAKHRAVIAQPLSRIEFPLVVLLRNLRRDRMDVIFYILFLLKCFAIFLAISRQSNAKTTSQMESYFRKISKYGGEYADILESLLPLTRRKYVTLYV